MGVTKSQIEADLANKGDFVKIDHLQRHLQKADSLEIKKFILTKLAGIYEEKGFLIDAAKYTDMAAEIAVTYKEKIDIYMKEAEMYVKVGKFELADAVFKKAYAYGNSKEKAECQLKYSQFYYAEARKNEKEIKIRKAAEVYEKIYSMAQKGEESLKIKQKLLELYNKLGRVRDYSRLASTKEQKPEEKPKIQPGSFEDLGIRKY